MENEALFNSIKNYVTSTPGYMKFNNFQLEEIKNDYVRVSVLLNENSTNPSGFAHGGLIYALADSTMGILGRVNYKNVVTINANINYLKPTVGKYMYAIATPIRVGATIAVYNCDIYNDKNEITATCTGTYYFTDYKTIIK